MIDTLSHTFCRRSPTYKHEPNWQTMSIPEEAADDEFLHGVVDVNCKHCGLSGAVRVNEQEINWE